MKSKLLIRFFALLLAAFAGLAFISYAHKKPSANQECTGDKCEQKKAQTDFILLESLAKHLLSATDN
jgi:hypothetical protein